MNKRCFVISFLILAPILLVAQEKNASSARKLKPSEEIQQLKMEQEKLLSENHRLEEEKRLEIEKLQKKILEDEKALKDQKDQKSQKIQSGFIDSMFFTLQFGGGMMLSGGVGFSFFNNVVRPEVLVGYTPSGIYKDVSITAKLNARVLGIALTDELGFFATTGASFTFFSGNAKVASAAFLSQEFDFKDIGFLSTLTFYLEEDFFFVDNAEGNLLFQIAAGIRMAIF